MGAISPIQSAAPMATLKPPAMHPQNFTWKRSHSSLSVVSFGFIAAAALISLFLLIAVFEILLRRPSLRPISIYDRSSDNNSEDPATEFSVKRDGEIIGAVARISVLMPGQTLPTFVASPAPVPCSHKEISSPILENCKTGSSSFDAGTVLNIVSDQAH